MRIPIMTSIWIWVTALVERVIRDAVEYFRHGLQALLDEKFTAGIRGRRPIVDTLQFQWDGIFYIRLHVRLEEVLRAEGTKEKTDTGE